MVFEKRYKQSSKSLSGSNPLMMNRSSYGFVANDLVKLVKRTCSSFDSDFDPDFDRGGCLLESVNLFYLC